VGASSVAGRGPLDALGSLFGITDTGTLGDAFKSWVGLPTGAGGAAPTISSPPPLGAVPEDEDAIPASGPAATGDVADDGSVALRDIPGRIFGGARSPLLLVMAN